MKTGLAFSLFGAVVFTACASSVNQQGGASASSSMTFFVTSVGSGKGADLGGLGGADKHCQDLAQAAGAGVRTWHAYLSARSAGGAPAVNARDRIGAGPWRNANGVVIAQSVEDLHGPNNNLNKQTALTEKGQIVPGRGDSVNQHDILTGSSPEGTAISGNDDATCSNWRSSDQGAAMLGHHDRMGLRDDAPSKSWNSSHLSRGCSQENLRGTGGAGYFYCFAVN